MNSNSKSTVCGDLISKKPNGKGGVSSAEPINRTGKTDVSPPNGKAVVFSDVPIKHTGQMKNWQVISPVEVVGYVIVVVLWMNCSLYRTKPTTDLRL
ncbi:BnaAnng25960D [Brassica napus]|uniref:(rape) hypothetical protein n=1 Tax=Brassica napus TaxID=3708 RepID=A0A078JKH2_BRANA|nr:unnamed protein product [Brassica napus]CDY68028.1 BnaAnng25960D [Brassica napus]